MIIDTFSSHLLSLENYMFAIRESPYFVERDDIMRLSISFFSTASISVYLSTWLTHLPSIFRKFLLPVFCSLLLAFKAKFFIHESLTAYHFFMLSIRTLLVP
jgi:hypothetical protein